MCCCLWLVGSQRETVKKILEAKPYTRNSYWQLYMEYLIETKIAYLSKQGGYYIPFKHIGCMPSPESITRIYRKLCETHPEYRSTGRTRDMRIVNKMDMDHINSWWRPDDNGFNKVQSLILPFD